MDRFSGSASTIDSIRQRQPGDPLENDAAYWQALRELQHPFFSSDQVLWRIALPQTAAQPDVRGEWLIEWGGAQRWLRSDAPEADIRTQVASLGGHATLFHGGDRTGPVFQPLPAGLWQLHQRLKYAFDPAGILNPGRLYEGL